MFVFGTAMLKCEGYSDKSDFFNNNDRRGGASNRESYPLTEPINCEMVRDGASQRYLLRSHSIPKKTKPAISTNAVNFIRYRELGLLHPVARPKRG